MSNQSPTLTVVFVDQANDPHLQRLIEETQKLGYQTIHCSPSQITGGVLGRVASSLLLIAIRRYQNNTEQGLNPDEIPNEFRDAPVCVLTEDFANGIIHCPTKPGQPVKIMSLPETAPTLFRELEGLIKQRRDLLAEKQSLQTIFWDETGELLETLEEAIFSLESQPRDAHLIDRIFRIIHTIKGGSGVLEWPEFTQSLHAFENILTRVKQGELPANASLISVLLQGMDLITNVAGQNEPERRDSFNAEKWINIFNHFQGDLSHKSDNARQATPRQERKEDSHIKIPTTVLDEFMELAGEITVIRNTVNKLINSIEKQLPGHHDIVTLEDYLEEMHKINASMQHKIGEMRKIPLKVIFRSYPRTIRDVAMQLGKQVSLSISGDDLRVDTKLAQLLKNSLIHLLRNAVDHGIEPPTERLENGKSTTGEIKIQAYEEGDDVMIRLSDDGRGMDPQRIGHKAVEKGLITLEHRSQLTDEEILQLILEPGFSTSEAITDISGRGVGMDMVKTSAEEAGGKLVLTSQPGQGSAFHLQLPRPKSVYIIESLKVKAGGHPWYLPHDQIRRLIKLTDDQARQMLRQMEGHDFLTLNGELIPLLRLETILFPETQTDPAQPIADCVLVTSEKGCFGLIVDDIDDSEEIVVKKLGPHIHQETYLGATFLDDSTVGLILNAEGLGRHLNATSKPHLEAAHDQQQSHAVTPEDGEEFIVFKCPIPGLYAFPLADVYRLEEIKPEDIQRIGNKMTMIYQEKVLTIHHPARLMEQSPSLNIESDQQQLIVLRRNHEIQSFLVDDILEVISSNEDLLPTTTQETGIMGHLLHNDQIITVLNPETVFQQKSVDDSAQLAANAAVAVDVSQGWGLF
jgi:two-component system chemotaxis sensor kinase CheA